MPIISSMWASRFSSLWRCDLITAFGATGSAFGVCIVGASCSCFFENKFLKIPMLSSAFRSFSLPPSLIILLFRFIATTGALCPVPGLKICWCAAVYPYLCAARFTLNPGRNLSTNTATPFVATHQLFVGALDPHAAMVSVAFSCRAVLPPPWLLLTRFFPFFHQWLGVNSFTLCPAPGPLPLLPLFYLSAL